MSEYATALKVGTTCAGAGPGGGWTWCPTTCSLADPLRDAEGASRATPPGNGSCSASTGPTIPAVDLQRHLPGGGAAAPAPARTSRRTGSCASGTYTLDGLETDPMRTGRPPGLGRPSGELLEMYMRRGGRRLAATTCCTASTSNTTTSTRTPASTTAWSRPARCGASSPTRTCSAR